MRFVLGNVFCLNDEEICMFGLLLDDNYDIF